MTQSYPIQFGRYEIMEQLAVGGMAELFLARSTRPAGPDEPVVIKRLLPHLAHDPRYNVMFINEARLTARLRHPNIVATYELDRHGDQLFMVLEFVDGLDGLAMLRECAHRRVRLPAEVAVQTIHEVLDALDFAHTLADDDGQPLGVVHRDISPSNVLLSRGGDVKLLDFGIARVAQRQQDTNDGTLKGKYGYMSPEQVIDTNVDARSDLFSVGVVLAEMLTGRRLFAAQNELDVLLMVRDVRLDRLDRYGGHMDGDLDRILRRALAKEPDHRFASAAEFRDALAGWMHMRGHEVTPAMLAEIVESLYEGAWQRRRETIAQAGATRAALLSTATRSIRDRSQKNARRGGGVVQLVAMDGTEGSAPHIEGIPAGYARGGDGVPQLAMDEDDASVSIEVAGAEDGADELGAADGVVAVVVDGEPSVALELDDLDDFGHEPEPVSGDERVLELVDPALDFDDREVSSVGNPRLPSVLRLAPAGALERAGEAAKDGPDDTGEFGESPAIVVLFRLALGRATGLLVTTAGAVRKDVYFREGIPEYVSSNVASELFGEYLLQQGVLSAGELSTALGVMPHFGGKLGDTLVHLGLLRPLDVFRHLTRQVRHKLVDVCTWPQGTFSWYGGRENPREAFPLDLNAFEIIGAGAMVLPDSMVESWLATLPPRSRPRAVRDARVSPSLFLLGSLMDDVHESLDGQLYLTELKAVYREQGEYGRFVRLLYLLVHTGLAVLD